MSTASAKKVDPKTETKPAATAKKSSRKAAAAKSSTAKTGAAKSGGAKAASAKAARKSQEDAPKYKVNDQIVYPAHGVGKITDIETQEIANMKIELYVIDFDHEKMKLRVPTDRAAESGMRPLSSPEIIDKAIHMLQGRARIKRTMWSRRAQEYEAKINSGDLKSVAEVVRDLYRSDDQPEQSYSERQLYEQALDRMGREVAAVRKVSQKDAIKEMEDSLSKKKVAA
ncbi:CarD family transcriptional regulator [Aquisalinus flavus]|uniref:CarD family transcriptional regulator n=1 Tax=Aquisalinus flavus TaxID=1526572 RepID=UPI0019D6EFCD|nr:CarD family transcriptional regulator [Aquisalinus flavus]